LTIEGEAFMAQFEDNETPCENHDNENTMNEQTSTSNCEQVDQTNKVDQNENLNEPPKKKQKRKKKKSEG